MSEPVEKDAPVCGCCESDLVNGACPNRWVDNDGEECRACTTPPAKPASDPESEGTP